MAEILVVDDEIGIRELLSEILGDEGHTVFTADCAQSARQLRDDNVLDLVLLDIWMPGTDGLSLLKEWAGSGKLTMPVIMMSGHATIDTAVEATRVGALDFLEKPIALQKLLKAVEQGLARRRAQSQAQLRAASSGTDGYASGNGGALTTAGSYLPVAGALGTVGAAPSGLPASVGNSMPAATMGGYGYGDGPGVTVTDARMAAVMLRELPLDLPLREARDAFERVYFEHHLSRENGSMTRVAERTGLERTHLYRKLKQLGIDLSKGTWRKNAAQ